MRLDLPPDNKTAVKSVASVSFQLPVELESSLILYGYAANIELVFASSAHMSLALATGN